MVRLLAVLVVAQIMSVANANLIAVALPPLSADLGASAVQEQWIVDAYVLVFAALLVAGGVLADRYGRRRALLAGFALFGVGSLVSALAPDPGVLIAARVVQALGPPLILPASLAILTANLADPAARARAIGYWGAASGFGVAVGPLIGGAVVSGFGWRWAFGVSVIVAAALAFATRLVIPDDRPSRSGHPFDWLGALLVTGALGALVFALIEGPERGWVKLSSHSDLGNQCREFMTKSQTNSKWANSKLMDFVLYQKERVYKNEIVYATIRNYLKTVKVFLELNSDVPIVNWKRITKGLPSGKSAANDRAPTIEEIKKLVEYPDRRIKPIIYCMVSGGFRIGAWNYLKWKHVTLLTGEDREIIAVKMVIYSGEPEGILLFLLLQNHITR